MIFQQYRAECFPWEPWLPRPVAHIPSESSCSALIPLCFLTHWPGMWCYFITEAEATSSLSRLRAPATHSLSKRRCCMQSQPTKGQAIVKGFAGSIALWKVQSEHWASQVSEAEDGNGHHTVAERGAGERRDEGRAREPSTRNGAGRQRSRRLHCHSVSHGSLLSAHSSQMGLSAGRGRSSGWRRCHLHNREACCVLFFSFWWFLTLVIKLDGHRSEVTAWVIFNISTRVTVVLRLAPPPHRRICAGLTLWPAGAFWCLLFLMGSSRVHVRQVGSSKLSMWMVWLQLWAANWKWFRGLSGVLASKKIQQDLSGWHIKD